MGIRNLNSVIKEHCNDAICKLHLSEIKGKTIVIDTSIYMYRYSSDSSLIENMYLMISLFRYHQITPIFVFDGKPPHEKIELLKIRKEEKLKAKANYDILSNKLKFCNNYIEREEIMNQMYILKKIFVTISVEDRANVKTLMDNYGVCYIHADGEADRLCAKMVIKNFAWACLSEDTDMFVYGCPRVLRYFSLVKSTLFVYRLDSILDKFKITLKEFREICVLSGTDYNYNESENVNIYNSFEYFEKYRKYTKKKKKKKIEFYDWLQKNDSKFCNDSYKLYSIYIMYDLNNIDLTGKYKNKQITNKPVNTSELRKQLKNNGFIYLDEKM